MSEPDDTIIDDSIAARMAEFRATLAAAFDEQQTHPSLTIEPEFNRDDKLDGATLTVEVLLP